MLDAFSPPIVFGFGFMVGLPMSLLIYEAAMISNVRRFLLKDRRHWICHDWTEWSDPTMRGYRVTLLGKTHEGLCLTQARSCRTCKKTEIRSLG